MISILERLKAKGKEGLTGSIADYQSNSEDTFELDTQFAKHKTLLRYEATGNDAVLRVELTHFLGHLDLNKTDNDRAGFDKNPGAHSNCLRLRSLYSRSKSNTMIYF